MNSTDRNKSQQLLDSIKNQSNEVERLKQIYGIIETEFAKLRKIGSEYTDNNKEVQAMLYTMFEKSRGMDKQSNLEGAPDRA